MSSVSLLHLKNATPSKSHLVEPPLLLLPILRKKFSCLKNNICKY